MNPQTARRFVLAATLVVDDTGGEQTFYFASHGFRTRPTDTPASTYIAERLRLTGGYKWELDFDGQAEASFGVVELINTDGGLDAFATYNRGGAATMYWGPLDGAFPADYQALWRARVETVSAPNLKLVRMAFSDRKRLLDKPVVTAMLAGTGGLQGTVGGRLMALALGKCGLVPLIPVNPTLQIYLIHANAVNGWLLAGLYEFGYVFEGGFKVSRGTPYATQEELFSTAPASGFFRLWAGRQSTHTAIAPLHYTRGPLYVRLGTPPVFDLRFGCDGLLQNSDSETPRPWKFVDLANRSGLSDVTPSTLATLQGTQQNFPAGNRYIEAQQTYNHEMSDGARSVIGCYGFTRADEFFCVKLLAPEDGVDASQFTATFDNCIRDSFERLPVPGFEHAVGQVNVNSGRAFESNLTENASSAMKELLTRKDWLVSFTGTSAEVFGADPLALSLTINIDAHDFPEAAQQLDFVTRYGRLFGVLRELVRFKTWLTTETAALNLHDKITVRIPRLGYDAGVLFRIWGMELDQASRVLTITAWGNSHGPVGTWVLGGGTMPGGSGDPGGSGGGGLATSPNRLRAILGQFRHRWFARKQTPGYMRAFLGAFTHRWASKSIGFESPTGGGGPLGFMVYEGQSDGTEAPSGSVPTGPAAAARSAYYARLGAVDTLDFESNSDNDQYLDNPFTLNGVEVTLTNPDNFGDPLYDPAGAYVVNNTAALGRSNTTSGGANYLDLCQSVPDDTDNLQTPWNFDPPAAHFGSYFRDLGDFSGQLSYRLTKFGGGTVEDNVTHSQPNLGAVWWSFVDDSGDTYTKLEFFISNEIDAWGMDDICLGTGADIDN